MNVNTVTKTHSKDCFSENSTDATAKFFVIRQKTINEEKTEEGQIKFEQHKNMWTDRNRAQINKTKKRMRE